MTIQFSNSDSNNQQIPKLDDKSFKRISNLIYEKSGIVLANHKQQMAEARIARRLRALGISSFETYLDQLETSPTEAENVEFINALTTNLTSFFREPHHFTHLKDVLLPKLTDVARIRLWSSACSTGEEPYSMALVIHEFQKKSPASDIKILATDIDTNVLAKAATGVYLSDNNDHFGPDIAPYINGISLKGKITLPPEIKNKVRFNRLNLMEDWPFKGNFNAVFCRNVTIYFDSNQRKNLINKMVNRLLPGGYLYLGHSEALIEPHPELVNEGHTIYRKL